VFAPVHHVGKVVGDEILQALNLRYHSNSSDLT
jgi:hypothetical protein